MVSTARGRSYTPCGWQSPISRCRLRRTGILLLSLSTTGSHRQENFFFLQKLVISEKKKICDLRIISSPISILRVHRYYFVITRHFSNLFNVDARLQTIVLGDEMTEGNQLFPRLGFPGEHHNAGQEVFDVIPNVVRFVRAFQNGFLLLRLIRRSPIQYLKKRQFKRTMFKQRHKTNQFFINHVQRRSYFTTNLPARNYKCLVLGRILIFFLICRNFLKSQ